MSKLYRSLLWSGLVAAGVAACGDDVTVNQPTPTVHSVSVGPTGTIGVGQTVQMIASVNADQGIATTVVWTINAPASVATISATGLLTAFGPGLVVVQACSTVNTSVCDNASITISSSAPTVTGITVTPGAQGYVLGQTPVTYTASVQGANNPPQTVAWSTASGLSTVVSVGAATGIVTIVAPGTEVVRACSTISGFTNVCGSSSVTVVAQQPTQISLKDIQQGGTTVLLSDVSDQVEVVLNVDPGAGSISKVQVLIGGAVAAEQTFTGPSAPAVAGDGSTANAVQEITLPLNTRQVRKLTNNRYVPVFFNGPNLFSAKLFVTGSATAIPSSNVIPVVLQNQDAWVPGTTPVLSPASLTPTFTTCCTTVWYRSNINFVGGANYIAFFPVTPSITFNSNICGTSGNAVVGTPTTGIAFSGTFTCGSPAQGAVAITDPVGNVTAGAAPAADVIYIAADDENTEQVGTVYTVAGESRYNLLDGGSLASGNSVAVDFKAPTISSNEIGFRAGCSATIPIPGCWINGSYSLAGDFPASDGGTGVASINTFSYVPGPPPLSCTTSSLTPANAPEDPSPTKYNACAVATDNIGNSSTAFGFNPFGVDKTNPTITYAKDAAVATALYTPNSTLAEAIPAQALDWKVNDNNSGLDTATALSVATSATLNGSSGSCVAINAALNAEPTPGADRFMIPANVIAPDRGCALPGYYHYLAKVTDRAGNFASDIDRIFGFEPGEPTINAMAPSPLYGGGTATTVTMFASHTGASLSAAKVGIWYTSNPDTPTEVQFVFDLGQLFNAPFQTPLFLSTPTTGTALTVAAGNSLAGVVIDSTEAPISAFDSLTAIIRDVFDATPLTGALVHADTANMVNPLAFIDATKVSTSSTVWANPKIGTPTFSGSGACTFTYATPTNGPTIPTAVWVVSSTVANQYNVLFTSVSAPTLISDNGTTRLYQYSVSASSTCASLGTLNLVAIKNDSSGLPVGYVVQ